MNRVLILAACGLLGCTSKIEPSRSQGTGHGPGSSGSDGSTSTSGGVGSGGATGGGDGSTSTTGVAGGATTGGSFNPNATDPGRVTLHRLNNTEYNNTVRDLLGTTQTPADSFPIDGSGAGFDNLADVLSLSPPHLIALNSAAEALVAEALSDSNQRARIVTCDLASGGASCAKSSLTSFATRAWRRPVVDANVAHYHAVIDGAIAAGDTPEQALTIALEAVLLSPRFLFRVELDADPRSLTPHALDPYELASRMSYFLWSSMPDDLLFGAAQGGTLTVENLPTEVQRMMNDGRAAALVENFAGQWLHLRKVSEHAPDEDLFPSFDPELQQAMQRESELLFNEIAFNGAPATDLINGNYTFLNDRLANHYGLASPGSSEFVRVDLTGNTERPGGILSHGSMLTVTSHAARTSPVKRGNWVLGQLTCTVVPPAPPNVDTSLDADDENTVSASSLREQLELHRADPTCAACHNVMDPIGLGLENYDAIGAYRTEDAGVAINASGTLPNGSTFNGPAELRELIASDPGFSRCLIQNIYTYAMGRVPETTNYDHMDGLTLAQLETTLNQTSDFATVVTQIVTSAPFTQRRGDPEAGQ